ncbi:hypothetical protein BH24CHL7_BH24CHL7_08350 [soil metagenome]
MTNEQYQSSGTPGAEMDPEAERIVSEIGETRMEMEGTIDQIGHRLQPQTIATQVGDQLREATVGRVERMMDDAGQTAQRTGNTVVGTIRENPVPAALAALGIGWLAMRLREQQSSGQGNGPRHGYNQGYYAGRGDMAGMYQPRGGDPMDGVRDSAQRVAYGGQDAAGQAVQQAQRLGENAQGAAQDVVAQTQQTVQQAQWQVQGTVNQAQRQFDRTLNDNPLAMAALAVGVGAAVALAIPETQQERELLGEHRDRLVSQAQSVATQALEQAESKVQETGEQLRSES